MISPKLAIHAGAGKEGLGALTRFEQVRKRFGRPMEIAS
jgi:hypothetical protein